MSLRESWPTLDLADIAEMIGDALTDLALSRHDSEREAEVFTEENQGFVRNIVNAISKAISKKNKVGQLSRKDIDLLIEQILIEHNAYDVAKSLLSQSPLTAPRDNAQGTQQNNTRARLIRRNGQVVPWNKNKIEVAVRKAFLSMEFNSEPAVAIAESVTETVLKKGLEFINIEDVQNLVQEELMRQGHYKVAEHYILYRAHRSALRKTATLQNPKTTAHQAAMIVVTNPDGSTRFWDGLDLKKRIDFAVIGLDLNMSKNAIEAELRRSIFPEISADALRTTIILNAKSLIERDADFALFAGRILLSYLYEETLDWDILNDGVEHLKYCHQRAFRRYLERGVKLAASTPSCSIITTPTSEKLSIPLPT